MDERDRGGAEASRAVEALLAVTPVLVGVAAHAIEQVSEEVSLSQFRLLRAIAELGPVPSVTVAERLGTAGSSVTRLADRLERTGYLVRRRGHPHRHVVHLELTPAGLDVVDRVIASRRAAFTAIVERLPSGSASDLALVADAIVAAVEPEQGSAPLELHAY